MGLIWIGIDAGNQHHHAAAVDETGRVLWSVRFANEQTAIAEVLARAVRPDDVARWATDLIGGETALLRAMLIAAGHQVIYVPGRTVKVMSGGFVGEAKTDARDAVVIANTARLRRDLAVVPAPTELVATLSLLVSYRADLVAEWVADVSRLRRLMMNICPALTRDLDFTTSGVLALIASYQTPQQLRDAGRDQLIALLRQHHGVHPAKVVDKALAAVADQDISLPGQGTAATLAADLASHLLRLRQRINDTERAIEQAFATHPQAAIIRSLPGIGTLIGAEFVVAVGDLSNFATSDHLAAYAGLAPMPRDSGTRRGNLHRPQRYNRRLRYVFYMSALTALRIQGPNRDYYQRKRAEGRRHQQAIVALARRRVEVPQIAWRPDLKG